MYPASFKDRAYTPFEWVVSDFALVDAIEAGLVKIPRTPTDDNTGEAVPKYRYLWDNIRLTLPKRTQTTADEHPLTDYLAAADGPLKQLAGAWESEWTAWAEAGRAVPPVLIIICHDTSVARLLEHHVAVLGEASPELVNQPGRPPVTVRIDSAALAKAEQAAVTEAAEQIRQLVATVGRAGEPGGQLRCLISVAMLAEGWDARNVTHILGLRAFVSQLLCEQVVGRGLRRSSTPTCPSRSTLTSTASRSSCSRWPRPQAATRRAARLHQGAHRRRPGPSCKIEFPRIVQVVPDIADTLDVDFDAIEPIRVTPAFDPTDTYVEFDLGIPHAGLGGEVQDRDRAYEHFRIQRLIFRVAAASSSLTASLGCSLRRSISPNG